jgi:uncharacterized protein (DUF1697 family)
MATVRYAALLRGINVGGNKKIAMADLRSLLTGLGLAAVATHLNSGNAAFAAAEQPAGALAESIERAIAADLGMSVRVLVRTGAQLAEVIDGCPMPEPENPSRFFVAFLSDQPDPALVAEIHGESFGPDQIWVRGREVYTWCPNGLSNTLLTYSMIEKRLGVTATSRNWNTVRKLASLTRDP